MILRAGLYERVSTEEQAIRGFSIETQKDNLTEYCNRSGMKIVDHYTDEGVSGAKPPLKRPELKRLLDDVRAGKVDVILFTKLDRWFRSVQEYFKVQEILDAHRVEWKAIHEDYDTTTANGKMAITIFLAVAQNERDRTSERIQVVFDHKRRNKEACFGGAALPLGYIKKPDENGVMRLVKDPETEQAVQEFWDILIKYNNLNKAIRAMWKYGLHRDWKTWKRITQNDFYRGIHRGIQDFCPSYVSSEDFLRFRDRETIKATRSGSVYYFRAMMRCPVCGNKLCGDTSHKNGRTYKSYRCPNRLRECNNNTSLSERKLESQLLDHLDEFLAGDIARAEVEQREAAQRPKVNISGIKERRRRLTVAYMAGNISDADYLAQDEALKKAIADAEKSAPPPERDLEPLKKLLETDFRGIYRDLDEDEKQRFWQSLIKEIEIDGKSIKRVTFF